MNPDVIVAGAGIVGAAVSFRLSASGRRVLTIDTAVPAGSATRASGAMLGVLGELTAHEAPADLALRVNAWSKHSAWWEEAALPAAAAGTFVVAGRDRPDDLAALAAMEAAAEKYGLRAERVDPGDIAELAAAPGYGPAGALYLADEAWVDGPVLRQLIIAAAVRQGTSVVDDIVVAVENQDDKVTGVLTRRGGRIRCPEVVLCTGVGVAAILADSRLDPALVPLIVAAKGVGLVLEGRLGPRYEHVLRTPNRQFACGLHIVPRGGGRVYAGSTNRVGDRMPGALGRATAGEVGQLLTAITRELAGPLADWDVSGLMYGLRPLPIDGVPIAGRTALDGLSVATGTYRNGVLLAPLLADEVLESLDGARPSPLSPQRPGPDVDVIAVLQQGLRELIDHWRYDEGARWHARLSPLLAGLAELALGNGQQIEARRRDAAEFLRAHGRPEMVPEAVIDLLSAGSAKSTL